MVTHKYEQKILYGTINDIFQHDYETHAVLSRCYHSGTTVNYAKPVIRLLCLKISNNAISKDDFLYRKDILCVNNIFTFCEAQQ